MGNLITQKYLKKYQCELKITRCYRLSSYFLNFLKTCLKYNKYLIKLPPKIRYFCHKNTQNIEIA